MLAFARQALARAPLSLSAVRAASKRASHLDYRGGVVSVVRCFSVASNTKGSASDYQFTHVGANEWHTLVDLQRYACETFPDRKLFGTRDPETGDYKWITYAEFQDLTLSFRAALRASGIQPGEKLAILSNNRLEWAVTAYACYGLKVPIITLYESQPCADWDYIIRDAEASYVALANHKVFNRLKAETKLLPNHEGGPTSKVRRYIQYDTEHGDVNGFAAWIAEGKRLRAEHPDAECLAKVCDDIKDTDLCTLIYTSGTTGSPKGVMLSHRNFCTNIKSIREIAGHRLSDKTVSLTFLPWAHVYGQTMELHQLISAGAAMGIAQSSHTLLEDMKRVKPTLLVAVPVVYHRIFDGVKAKLVDPANKKQARLFKAAMKVAAERREWFDKEKTGINPWLWLRWRLVERFVFSGVRNLLGGSLKYGFTGGATLSPLVQQWFSDIGIPIIEGYGLTETSPVIASERFGPTEATQGGLQAVPGVRMMICRFNVDASGDEVIPEVLKSGEEGEICTSGPNVMIGYYNKPEATKGVLFNLPGTDDIAFRTGDLGTIDAEGVLRITGRANEQYKLINGKFVVPSHIEDPFRLWSNHIFQAFVHGINKPHNIMLVVPNFESVRAELDLVGEQATPASIVANPAVKTLIMDEIKNLSHKVDTHYAVPKDILLIAEPFTVENGYLTPKLSMKRKAIAARYMKDIEALYGPGEK